MDAALAGEDGGGLVAAAPPVRHRRGGGARPACAWAAVAAARAGSSRSLFLLAPPELTDPGWLDPLIGLDCPFRLAIHLEGLDRKAERRRLKRRRRSLNVITLGTAQAGGVADVDMESAQAEARQQALETLDPARAILRMGLYLTVFADDPERLADYTERALSLLTTRLGAEPGRGIGHQLPLWQATLPLGLDPAGRRYRVRSETVGNAFPFLTHNPGMPAGFPLGFTAVGHELVLFDPAEPSPAQQPDEHRGPQRVRARLSWPRQLALMTLLAGGRVTVIDRAGHYEGLLAVAGGSAARLGSPTPPALNLWDHEGEVTAEKIGFVVDAHEIMLARQAGDRLDPAGPRPAGARHPLRLRGARWRGSAHGAGVGGLVGGGSRAGRRRGAPGVAARAWLPSWSPMSIRVAMPRWWIARPPWTWRHRCWSSIWTASPPPCTPW